METPWVIINTFTANSFGCEIERFLQSKGEIPPEQILMTQNRGDEARLVQKALAGGCGVPIIVSGDGGLNHAVNAGARRIGVVPIGTGIDIASCLGMKRVTDMVSFQSAFAEALQPSVIWLDLLKIETEAFTLRALNQFSFGLSGLVVEWVGERTARTKGMYTEAARRLMFKAGSFAAGFQGRRLRALDFYITNGPKIAGGIKIAPKASLNDAKAEITVIPDLPRLLRPFYLLAGTQGLIRRLPGVISTTMVEETRIRLEENVVGQIDGEKLPLPSGEIKVSIEPCQLGVCISQERRLRLR